MQFLLMPVKVFSIQPTYAVEFNYFDSTERSAHQYSKPPVRTNTTVMSKESRKQLMNSIQWLKLFSPLHKVYCKERKAMVNFRLNFITLTLSADQIHDDKYIKKHMLEPFLKWLARQGANSYVWKAEAQNNGNIHFHITTNRYIHWLSIRNKWNSLQSKHGYLAEFFKAYGHHDPNSTDVHAVRNDKDIGRYMGKYFGKLENWCKDKTTRIPKEYINHPSRFIDNCIEHDKPTATPKRQIEGRKWAVSNNLANLKCFITEQENEYFETTTDFIKGQNYEHINTDFASIWFYPHLSESGAPRPIIEKLQKLKYKVDQHDN